jgi:hypothetical protein
MDPKPGRGDTFDPESGEGRRSEAQTWLERWFGAPAELAWRRSAVAALASPVRWDKRRPEFGVFRIPRIPLEGLLEVRHDGLGAIRCQVVQTWRPGSYGAWPMDVDNVMISIAFSRLGPP